MTIFSLPLAVDVIARASVILAVTALAAASLRRASAAARHFVWTLGLVSALAAPALSPALPRWELPIVRVSAPAALAPAPALPSAEPDIVRSAPAFTGSQTQDRLSATPANSAPWSRPTAEQLLLVAWMAGATLILARMFLGLLAVHWMSRRARTVVDAPWTVLARTLARDLALTNVRFLRGRAGTMPMAWGIFRPSVLMPVDADEWPVHRLRVVLLHELAHVKRRDCLTHLIAQIACAAYWFNPLAWMAARRLRAERERACDDLVLASGTRGSEYADQLLDIARVMRAGRFPAVLAGASLAMAQRSQLEGRLMAILDPSVPRRALTRTRAAASAAVFAFVMVVVASVQPWAEERAAVGAQTADRVAVLSSVPISLAAQQPVEPRRAEVRQNADGPQGIAGVVRGALEGRVQGGVDAAVANGVVGAVVSGVAGAVADGVASAVADAVTGGVTGSMVGGITYGTVAEAVGEAQNEREKVAEKGRARDPRAVNALLEALKDTDKDVRETAMNALVQMRDPRMFDPFVAALKDSSADIREQAAAGLGRLRDPRAIEPLAGVLKDQSASVREQAVFALGQLRAAAAIDAISIALHDTSASVREQAAFALGQIRDRRAVEPLISALKDEKPDVREQAAFALGQMRDPRALEALVIALKDPTADVREQAAFALGQIGDARAIDGLTTALKDASAGVRQQAAHALGQIR